MDTTDLSRRFSLHKVDEKTQLKMESILEHAWRLASVIETHTPDGREKSLAMTKLEEVVFWAVAGMAREQK
jgi:hypothetical protein